MSSIFGKNVKISIFGQSHSPAIGVTIDGLPAGEAVDLCELQAFLARRAPGRDEFSTPRQEADVPEILSGLADGKTCGAPLTAIIRNSNIRPRDYSEIADIPRPGHADYPAAIKHGGHNDVSGGGHFSGRLTAPLCIAGGIIKQILARRGVRIFAHIHSIGGVFDDRFDSVNSDASALESVANKDFPVINDSAGEAMKARILEAKADGDSVGGSVECVTLGMPTGVGAPIFRGVENKIAQVIFGIPAIKAVEFGNWFECAELLGSENNDAYFCDKNGKIRTKTNNHGGILGGMTTGMPVVFRVAVKPTPSIAKAQDSVSLSGKTAASLSIKGRHDPCIVKRVVPVVEAAAAVAIYDLILG